MRSLNTTALRAAPAASTSSHHQRGAAAAAWAAVQRVALVQTAALGEHMVPPATQAAPMHGRQKAQHLMHATQLAKRTRLRVLVGGTLPQRERGLHELARWLLDDSEASDAELKSEHKALAKEMPTRQLMMEAKQQAQRAASTACEASSARRRCAPRTTRPWRLRGLPRMSCAAPRRRAARQQPASRQGRLHSRGWRRQWRQQRGAEAAWAVWAATARVAAAALAAAMWAASVRAGGGSAGGGGGSELQRREDGAAVGAVRAARLVVGGGDARDRVALRARRAIASSGGMGKTARCSSAS